MNQPRILCVDDNESNLKLFQLLLAGQAYEVRTARDAREALEALAAFRPHLILLDIQLPDIDGIALTRQIKGNPDTRNVVIVAVTAYAMRGDEERTREAGADDYIAKPIDKRRFREVVSGHLRGRTET